MRFPVLFLILLLATSLPGQTPGRRAVVVLDPADMVSLSVRTIPLEDARPFLAFFLRWEGPSERFLIRFSADARNWTDWMVLTRDEHNPDLRISQLSFVEPGYRYFQWRVAEGDRAPDRVECHFFSPGDTPAVEAVLPGPDQEVLSCPCPIPPFLNRSQWCPAGNCPEHPNPAFTNVTHLIVHHSAGTNVSNDWAAVVRSIWDFHVNGNGWSDIGYNWLIDPNGVVYQGRGNDVIGAHFCGTNSNTMGVCVLGNFTTVTPAAQALSSLSRLLAWKACAGDLDPLGQAFHPSSGRTLQTISGHRDGCATECPGNQFYPLLPSVRQSVQDLIISGCSGLSGPTQLQAMAAGPESIALNWQDNTEGESGFLLERLGGGSGNFTQIAVLPADQNAFEDTGLLPDTYSYRLRAFTGTDTSAYSNTASATLAPTALADAGWQAAVRVFPNPAGQWVRVTIDHPATGPLRLEVFQAAGRQAAGAIQKEKNRRKESFDIDLSGLAPGAYWLRVQMENHRGVFPLILLP